MERSVNTDPGSRCLPGLGMTAGAGLAKVCADERGPQVDGKSSLWDQSLLALYEAREAEAD